MTTYLVTAKLGTTKLSSEIEIISNMEPEDEIQLAENQVLDEWALLFGEIINEADEVTTEAVPHA